jgi:hypothetical protein
MKKILRVLFIVVWGLSLASRTLASDSSETWQDRWNGFFAGIGESMDRAGESFKEIFLQ